MPKVYQNSPKPEHSRLSPAPEYALMPQPANTQKRAILIHFALKACGASSLLWGQFFLRKMLFKLSNSHRF